MDTIVTDTLKMLSDTFCVKEMSPSMLVEVTSSSVCSTTTEIIIPLAVALLSFLLGLVADAILRNRAKKLSLKSIQSAIVFWYKKERISVEQTIQSVSDMANRIRVSELFQPEGTRISDIDLSRLSEFRLDELTNAFVENIKGYEECERFNYLYHFQKECRYIDKVICEIRIKHEQYVTDIRGLMDEWNYAYKRLTVEMDRFQDYTLRIKWQQLYRDCQMQGGGLGDHINFEKWDSIIIEPFIQYCESDEVKYKQFAIMVKLDDLRTIIIKIRGERAYSKVFTDYADLMEKAIESLDRSVGYIESAKIKWWIH